MSTGLFTRLVTLGQAEPGLDRFVSAMLHYHPDLTEQIVRDKMIELSEEDPSLVCIFAYNSLNVTAASCAFNRLVAYPAGQCQRDPHHPATAVFVAADAWSQQSSFAKTYPVGFGFPDVEYFCEMTTKGKLAEDFVPVMESMHEKYPFLNEDYVWLKVRRGYKTAFTEKGNFKSSRNKFALPGFLYSSIAHNVAEELRCRSSMAIINHYTSNNIRKGFVITADNPAYEIVHAVERVYRENMYRVCETAGMSPSTSINEALHNVQNQITNSFNPF